MKYLAVAMLGLLVAGCDVKPPKKQRGPAATAEPDRDQAKPAGGPEIVLAPAQGDVADLVKQELGRAQGRPMLVYVSASWCEPCRHFEDAVKSGQLAREFPRLHLYKFDFDRDEVRLAQAGYTSNLIPLFAVPGPDGRAGEQRMEGSIKGPEAVATNLVPRLRQLLGR